MKLNLTGQLRVGDLTGGPSSINLSDLHDVSISAPQTGQYLRYNSSISEWQNAYIVTDVYNYLNTNLTGTNGVILTKLSGPQTVNIGLSVSASGDASGTLVNGDVALTLATVNSSPQTDSFRKVTINGKGLTTASSAVSFADIVASLGYTPTNNAGGTMTGALILSGDPVNALGAVTKQYADSIASGVSVHPAAQTATTTTLDIASSGTVTYNNGVSGVGATLTTTGTFGTIGGYATQIGDRILVKDEVSALRNGAYVKTSTTVLTRAVDMDGSAQSEVAAGSFLFVQDGTLIGTGWIQTTTGIITVGTTPMVFSQFSGAGTYTAGIGLNLIGNQFSNAGVLSTIAGSNISVSSATGNVTISVIGTVPSATNLAAGAAGSIPYQTGAATTTFLAADTTNKVLISGSAPSWTNVPTLTGTNFSGIPNGALLNNTITIGSTVTALGATSTSLAGLTSVTSSLFTGPLTGLASSASALVVTDDLATATSVYPTWISAAGTAVGHISTTKLSFVPSTGILSATGFAGAFSGTLTGSVVGAASLNVLKTGDTVSGSLVIQGTATTIQGLTVGRGAGAVATNTVLGTTALSLNSTGATNTAIGYEAMKSATDTGNTAIGYRTLLALTTGSNNTALGTDALGTVLTANNNVAIGKGASTATTGANNTSVGTDALSSNSTGALNVCIGYAAGSLLTTGSNNTFIGGYAGTAGLSNTVVISAGTTERMRIDSSGNTTFQGTVAATSYNSTSTKRVKKCIKDLGQVYLNNFSKLKPREYDRKDYKAHEFGFIAEEMALVYPEIVGIDLEGKAIGIDYSKLSAILTAKVQQQEKVITDLQNQVTDILRVIKGLK